MDNYLTLTWMNIPLPSLKSVIRTWWDKILACGCVEASRDAVHCRWPAKLSWGFSLLGFLCWHPVCISWFLCLLAFPSQPSLTLLSPSVSSDVSLFAGTCVDTELCKFFSWFVFNKTEFHQRKYLTVSNTVHKHPCGHLGCFRYRTSVFLSYLLCQTIVVHFGFDKALHAVTSLCP